MPNAGGNRRMKKNDFWADKAKHAGYPARSVYKLEEILAKMKPFKADARVLDLGAAPGSWSLYLARQKQVEVISSDLKALTIKHPKIKHIMGDFFDEKILAELASYGPYDAVVCDAAPSTSGDRLVDSARSYRLAEHSWRCAERLLTEGGLFITKIFAGGEENDLLAEIKQKCKSAKIMRPKAIRNESFELYLVGEHYSAHPKKE